ncbi:MAG: ATP-binding cassette domain-containing protein [Romboutsia timonensis]|uniref:ATP-binding cassette domain-containing protein n=1 Tax=uncultured Clostridium sp. TaxID=59620 RepID=UPI002E7A69A6|nr:ATP-binding cassette domain-containing protein [Romboutsia timonensis]MEE0710709.1 ATP-binding cassette domain-containing protein [Romboutsia timonensis]
MIKLIKIENYTQKIKKDIILNDINLHLKENKIYGFVGRNGSGKSILFKGICGLLNISNGKIIIKGKEIGKDIDFYDNLGAVLDGAGFLPNLSSFDNLKLLASIRNKISDSDIKSALNKVGLDPNDKKKYKKYSLGMKQKLALAQAIMENPELLILDEPFNGLDSYSVKDIREMLIDYKKEGKTILISSHIKEDIDILCDEVYELDRGNINKLNIGDV